MVYLQNGVFKVYRLAFLCNMDNNFSKELADTFCGGEA